MSAPDAMRADHVVVAKPCEIFAARQLARHEHETNRQPLLLSFFCAGTPSQHATERLLVDLGLPNDCQVSDLWYRGRGWPGRFTAQTPDGEQVSASYDESWGRHLGPFTQWRCKICPDGVGESGDISAADFWRSDAWGYPDFTEGDGCSAVLARTPRGHDVLTRAFAAGVLIGRPLDLDALAAVQPLQVSRRATLLGRLAGTVLAGRPVPRYRGFGLLRLAIRQVRQTAWTARGSYRRVREQVRRRE
jgi:coenzyme F420 hydrogenase subunit beta